jgi:hypothetical protein
LNGCRQIFLKGGFLDQTDVGFQAMILEGKRIGIGKKPLRYGGENIKLKRQFDFRQCFHDTGGACGMSESVGRYEKSNAPGRDIRLISIRQWIIAGLQMGWLPYSLITK